MKAAQRAYKLWATVEALMAKPGMTPERLSAATGLTLKDARKAMGT